MLLKNNCSSSPQAALVWQTAPATTYKLLVQQYSHSPKLLRNSLSRQYQALNFSGYKSSLTDFNATFNNVVARLTLSKLTIDPIDKVNQYLKSLETVFPLWIKKPTNPPRTKKTIKNSVTALNLEFLIADILKEQKNP